MIWRILRLLLVLLVLFAAFLAWGFYSITRKDRTAAAVAPPTPQQRQSAERTLERLREEFRGADTPKPEARAAPERNPRFEVHLTEAEANELLQSLPDVQKSLKEQKVRALQVSFEPGRLIASARVPLFRGLEGRLSAVGQVQARDGKLAYRTEGVYVGDFPAPPQLRRELDRELAKSVERLNDRFEGRIDEVRLEDGSLTVSGTRPP